MLFSCSPYLMISVRGSLNRLKTNSHLLFSEDYARTVNLFLFFLFQLVRCFSKIYKNDKYRKNNFFSENPFPLYGKIFHRYAIRILSVKKNNTEDTTVSPYNEGYRYPDSDTIPAGPCNVCESRGWLTKSQLEEKETENNLFEGMDEG